MSCWYSYSAAGNLGDGEHKDRDGPVLFRIEAPPLVASSSLQLRGVAPKMYKKIAQVACGARHAVALCEDGDVYSYV